MFGIIKTITDKLSDKNNKLVGSNLGNLFNDKKDSNKSSNGSNGGKK
jgi:hypothetical protein